LIALPCAVRDFIRHRLYIRFCYLHRLSTLTHLRCITVAREIAETKRKGGRDEKIEERGKRGQKCAQASSAATLAMYKSHLLMTMTPGDGDEE